jgi:hypothetical protein
MARSDDTRPRVDQLRDELRRRKLSESEIEGALQQAGYTQPSSGGIGHMLGLAGRGVVQGLGGLADLNPYTAPQRIGNQIAGIPQPPTGPTTADQLGLPTPTTRGERIGVAAAEGVATALPFAGASTGGAVLKAGQAAVGGLANAAGQGAKEEGFGPLGQIAASAVVGGGLPLVGSLGPEIIRTALAGTATRREVSRQFLALMQANNPDAAVTLGEVAQGGVGRTVEGLLRNTPGASQTIKRGYERQAVELKGRVDALANQAARGGTPTTAGAAVQRGIEEGFIPRFKAISDQLYDRVWQLVPWTTPVIPANTVGVFARQGALAASARPLSEHLLSPAISRWAEDMATTLEANPKGIPIETIKAFRSKLGNMLSGADVVEGVDLGDVKQLYGALSDDLRTAIEHANPRALPAWDRAQLHWRAGQERIQGILQPLLDKRTPEIAFKALLNGSREGATVLRSTMNSLRPAEQRLVTATVLRNLGKARPLDQDDLGQVFSPETFLTRYHTLAPEARAALFDGIDPAFGRDLGHLAKAMNLYREAHRTLANPSGTAINSSAWSVMTALGALSTGAITGSAKAGLAAAGSSIAAVVGGNLAARAFTNPRIVHWLVRQTRVPTGALAQELVLLTRQAKDWSPEERDLAEEVRQALDHVDWRGVRFAAFAADATRVERAEDDFARQLKQVMRVQKQGTGE